MSNSTQKEIDCLEENRIIFVNGNFDERKAEQTITKLFQYECQSPTKDILMIIDSYGGYVDSFVAIHDCMKLLRCDIATVCAGKAMSCGQMLLISGKKGKRFITPNSRVLIHEISAGSYGKLTDLTIDVEETKRMQKEIFEKLLLSYTKIKSSQLKDFVGIDTYLNAKRCLELGLVDKIITSANSLYSEINI